jgi:dTDP-4-amino-4,6-dideoxygalactose transaminase
MAYNIKIPFAKIHYGPEEKAALMEVLESGWWSTGAKTAAFEKAFAEYVGARHAVFVESCTAALFLAIKALGLSGQTFRVPSFTFTASASEIVHSGNQIEFVDVAKKDLCVHGKFDAPLMKIHYGGNYTDAAGTVTVEDSAHLIRRDQCRDNSNLVCFSLAYNKNITAAEGGMLATNDPKIYDWLIKARFFGINRFGLLNSTEHPDWLYSVDFLGWKANTSEFHAALGLVQLKKLETINARRQKIVEYYNQAFGYAWRGLHLYPVFVPDRVAFLRAMFEAGIQCSVHYTPLHWMPAYKDFPKADLTNTEWLGKHLVSLPLYPDLTDAEVEYIAKTAKAASGEFLQNS